MKAIKKQITRKFRITTEDTEIFTKKDNTKNIAKAYSDIIIQEDDGSEYVMSRVDFDKRYDITSLGICMSKANEIDYILNDSKLAITFTASWGEEITAYPNAAIVIENGKFGYAIQEDDFKNTYNTSVIDKDRYLNTID